MRAQFCAFTFVSPILQSMAGVTESDLPRVLLAYGVATAVALVMLVALTLRKVSTSTMA